MREIFAIAERHVRNRASTAALQAERLLRIGYGNAQAMDDGHAGIIDQRNESFSSVPKRVAVSKTTSNDENELSSGCLQRFLQRLTQALRPAATGDADVQDFRRTQAQAFSSERITDPVLPCGHASQILLI
ncbi:MAG: hypothetical protein ABIP16_02595 [Thermomonas sp.]